MVQISFKDIFAPSFWQAWNDFLNHKYTDMWFTGGRGCIAPETKIETPSGEVKIEDFQGGEIFSFDGGKIISAYACKPIRYTCERLYRVKTKNGHSILVTDEHRFLTSSGWRKLKDISIGEDIFSSYLHNLPLPTSSSFAQNAPPFSHETKQTHLWKSSLLCSLKVSSFLHQILYEGCQSLSPEDVLRSMRKLLGFLYCYWQDSRLYDAPLPMEEDTYLDIVLQLSDVPGHSHEHLQKGVLAKEEKHTHYERHDALPSTLDCQDHAVDICYAEKETQIARRLFESLLETCASSLLSHKTENPAYTIQQVSRCLLSSIESSDSSGVYLSCGDVLDRSKQSQGFDSSRMLFDMLRRKVHDESYSDTFCGVDNKYITNDEVVSIAFEREDFYYDMFVPFYNNYIAEGIVNHNSTKSSFVTMCIVLGMIRDAQEAIIHRQMGDKKWMSYLTHAIVYRKVAADLRISVYNQFVWSIEKLGLSDKFKFSVSPLRIVYKATGQMIDFRGLDDPIKSKSIKAPFGYYKYNFFEELNQFDGIEEIRNVRQSIMRGGHCFQSFAAYNPSPCSADFCNVESRKIVPGRHVYHSDYRSVPREWLGDTFFEQAEILRRDNERAYRHEYLGEVTGNGGAVFPNLVIREVSDEEIALYDMKFFGIDFGFSLDPSVYLEIRMDKNHHRIFIIDEIYQTNLRNIEFAELLKQKPSIGYNYIMCDSAEPKSIADLEAYGINALPVVKVERRFGYKYLQSFNEIIIDPRRCPHAAEEFALAEYRKLASGLFVSEYPKTNDHCQDACLKGDTLVWTDKGLKQIKSLAGTTGVLYGFDIETKKEKLVPYCHCRKTRENAEILRLSLNGGGIIECTSDHRIMLVSGEYREAGNFKIGDECAGIRDGLVVNNITSSGKDRFDVYDIEVPETHNLIIGPGVAVHNCRYALSEVTAGAGMF